MFVKVPAKLPRHLLGFALIAFATNIDVTVGLAFFWKVIMATSEPS